MLRLRHTTWSVHQVEGIEGRNKTKEKQKESHGLYVTGDQHWGGAADNKAIHSMLRLHKDHMDTRIAQAGRVAEQWPEIDTCRQAS